MRKQQGFLVHDLAQNQYFIDWRSTASIMLGEIVLSEILSARPYFKGCLLDVGCGKRPYSLIYDALVSESIGTEVTFSPHGTSNADAICYAEALPFADASFDTILCTEVLEHTRLPQLAMQEFSRLLKPGGYLLLSMPFIYPIHEAPHDYQRFTKYGLQAIYEQVNLKPIYIHAKAGAVATLICLWAILMTKVINGISKGLKLSPPLRDRVPVRLALVIPQYVYLWIRKRLTLTKHLTQFDADITPGYVILAQRPE